jgi:glycosyltransferase involved in cell wall biosynthesis
LANLNPTLSVITPSLNTGEYLRDTLGSIAKQNFKNFEHIIVDGGSTDKTISILTSQSEAKWISRKEGPKSTITEAFREGFNISTGKYIMQCCISDGYLDENWFRVCVEYLDANPDISLVYGLPQYLNSNGTFGRVAYHDFFDYPPPIGQEGLAFLIATGFLFPEGNYCVRRSVFDKCFSANSEEDPFRTHPVLGFVYQFITQGYVAAFIPRIANYGRLHYSRQVWNRANEMLVEAMFYKLLRKYGVDIFLNRKKHIYKNEHGETIGIVDASKFRWQLIKQVILNLKILKLSPFVIINKITNKIRWSLKDVRINQ